MGMAYTQMDPYFLPVVRSTMHPTCFYCARCDATYTPNLMWGYRTRGDRYDTTGNQHLVGTFNPGNACPICRREPEAVS